MTQKETPKTGENMDSNDESGERHADALTVQVCAWCDATAADKKIYLPGKGKIYLCKGCRKEIKRIIAEALAP